MLYNVQECSYAIQCYRVLCPNPTRFTPAIPGTKTISGCMVPSFKSPALWIWTPKNHFAPSHINYRPIHSNYLHWVNLRSSWINIAHGYEEQNTSVCNRLFFVWELRKDWENNQNGRHFYNLGRLWFGGLLMKHLPDFLNAMQGTVACYCSFKRRPLDW